jgi:hypothetical protein
MNHWMSDTITTYRDACFQVALEIQLHDESQNFCMVVISGQIEY